MNIPYLKEKLSYLKSIQLEFKKKAIIQYQIAFIHSVLEFHFNNGINKGQLGIYASNNDLNYLLEEMPNSRMQRFVRLLRNNAFSVNEWNQFTTSKYRRGNTYSKDNIDVSNIRQFITSVKSIKSSRDILIHVIDEHTSIREIVLNNGSKQLMLLSHNVHIKITEEAFDLLFESRKYTYRYVRFYVNAALLILGYDNNELVFEHNTVTNYTKSFNDVVSASAGSKQKKIRKPKPEVTEDSTDEQSTPNEPFKYKQGKK